MSLLLFFFIFSLTSVSAVNNPNPAPAGAVSAAVPLDSQLFVTKDTPKPDGGNAFPVNSQLFVTKDLPKPSSRSAVQVNSQLFVTEDPSKPSSGNAIPVTSQLFVTKDAPKPSSSDTIPMNSLLFFTKDKSIPSGGGRAFPLNSQLFVTKDSSKPSRDSKFPVDSQLFYVGPRDGPKTPGGSASPADRSNLYAMSTAKVAAHPDNWQYRFNYLHSTHGENATYCSVYFRKEDLKKGKTLCPLFTPQSSEENKAINEVCQKKPNEGEHESLKFCTSSHQEIARQVTAKLGKNYKVVSSEKVQVNVSTIASFQEIASYGKAVVCHSTHAPPHEKFYCHQISKSSVYILSLGGVNDNQKLKKMLAVCHDDTSGWDPDRIAFKLLKMKPGGGVCHLLPSYDLAFVALD